MKHLATLSFTLAALAAAPAALAGSEIFKCVDGAGNVTLTDQACESGARATRMTVGAPAQDAVVTMAAAETTVAPASAAEQPQVIQRFAAPTRMQGQHDWRPRMPQRDRPLARDVATLKAARAQLLLLDSDRTQLITSR